MPDWSTLLLIILLVLVFPMVLVLAWIFDISPRGLQRTGTLLNAREKPTGASFGWSGQFAEVKETPQQIQLVEETPDPDRVRRASLAFVRHELRTPINAIIGYGEMLLDDAQEEGDDAAAADLGRIVRCGREIHSQVERILDADRVSAEQERNLDSYSEQIRADLRDPLSAVTGYTEMLIEASRESGHGARIADLERVLAAARKLLDLSTDIAALATHAPNPVQLTKGATLAEGVLAKIRAVQDHHAQPDRQGSLLVVDDSATTRDLLAKQLARKGYFVNTAASGQEALERMTEQQFDLVLLDVLMPELDGIGVLLRMKNDARLHEVPVIMISALDEMDSVVRCLELGAADFVSKPFHPTLLEARINSAMLASTARKSNGKASHDTPAAIARIVAGSFPEHVVERLHKGETRLLDGSAHAAVYFVDIDQAVASADPAQRAALTEALIDIAYRSAAQEGTIVLLQGLGLAMAAGFPQPEADAVQRMARTALTFTREAEAAGLRLRSGIHAGTVYSAVVGQSNLSYFVWGDAVDLARRLAISAERGQIQISAACYATLKEQFAIASRGVIEVAGRGQMRAYVLETEGAIAR